MIPVLVALVAFLLLAPNGAYCGGFSGVIVVVVVVGAVDDCGVTTAPRSSGNNGVIIVVVLGGGGGWPTTPIPLGLSANLFESPIVDRG